MTQSVLQSGQAAPSDASSKTWKVSATHTVRAYRAPGRAAPIQPAASTSTVCKERFRPPSCRATPISKWFETAATSLPNPAVSEAVLETSTKTETERTVAGHGGGKEPSEPGSAKRRQRKTQIYQGAVGSANGVGGGIPKSATVSVPRTKAEAGKPPTGNVGEPTGALFHVMQMGNPPRWSGAAAQSLERRRSDCSKSPRGNSKIRRSECTHTPKQRLKKSLSRQCWCRASDGPYSSCKRGATKRIQGVSCRRSTSRS